MLKKVFMNTRLIVSLSTVLLLTLAGLFLADNSITGLQVFEPQVTILGAACGQNLNIAGETYVMSADITGCSGDGLRILANDITLDCAGFTIASVSNPSANVAAINITGFNGTTIANCTTDRFRSSILITSGNVSNITIRNNTLQRPITFAQVQAVTSVNLANITIEDNLMNGTNSNAISIATSSTSSARDIIIQRNNLTGNSGSLDINVHRTNNATITDNIATSDYSIQRVNNTLLQNNSGATFQILGIDHIANNISIINNSAGQQGQDFIYRLSLMQNVTFANNTATQGDNGLRLSSALTNIIIENNTFFNMAGSTSEGHGIETEATNGNAITNLTLRNNNIHDTDNEAIWLHNLAGTAIIANNNITAINGSGMVIVGNHTSTSDTISITNNTITNAQYSGIEFGGVDNTTAPAVHDYRESSNTVANNTATGNANGIVVRGLNNTRVFNNTASSNTRAGLVIEGLINSNITNNTALDNNVSLVVIGGSANNFANNHVDTLSSPQPVVYRQIIDVSTGTSAVAPALAIGLDGYPRVVYYDGASSNIIFLRCTDELCTAPVKTIMLGDASADTMNLQIATDGFGRISFYNTSSTALEFIQCTNTDCSTFINTVVDSTADVGNLNALALGTDTFARIAYYDDDNDRFKYARCTNAACSTNVITIVETTGAGSGNDGGVGLQLGSDGFGRLTYHSPTDSGSLHYTECLNADCSSTNISQVQDAANNAGKHSQLILANDGTPFITFHEGGGDGGGGFVKLARLVGAGGSCSNTSWDCTTIQTARRESAIVFGPTGNPQILLPATFNNVFLDSAYCNNIACTSFQTVNIVPLRFQSEVFAVTSNDNTYASYLISKEGPSPTRLVELAFMPLASGGTYLNLVNTSTFNNTNITSDYGLQLINSHNNLFFNTLIESSNTWLFLDPSTNNNMTNTTFVDGNGTVQYTGTLNLASTANITQTQFNISNATVFLNSSNVSFMNTTARITLFNAQSSTVVVDFDDDGTFTTCNAPQCTNIVLNGSTLTFNVASFTTYQIGEAGSINFSFNKTDTPDPVTAGNQLSYTISIEVFNGTLNNATVVDLLPAGVTFDSSSPAPSSGNDTFTLGNLGTGNHTINITVTVSSALADGTELTNNVNLTFQNSTGYNFVFNESTTTTVSASGGGATTTGGGGSGGSSTAVCPPSCMSLTPEQRAQNKYCQERCVIEIQTPVQEPETQHSTPAPTLPTSTEETVIQETTPSTKQHAEPTPQPITQSSFEREYTILWYLFFGTALIVLISLWAYTHHKHLRHFE